MQKASQYRWDVWADKMPAPRRKNYNAFKKKPKIWLTSGLWHKKVKWWPRKVYSFCSSFGCHDLWKMYHLTKPFALLQSKGVVPTGTSTGNNIIKNGLPPVAIVPTVIWAAWSPKLNLNWEFRGKTPELKHEFKLSWDYLRKTNGETSYLLFLERVNTMKAKERRGDDCE